VGLARRASAAERQAGSPADATGVEGELARIKRMRDAAATRERTAQARSQAAAPVEEECEPSTSQRSSYPSVPPSVEAAVQAPSANAFAALVAFSLLAASAALCIAGMLVFYIARWVSETSVWLAALAATTFSGFANTAAAFCIAGLLHITIAGLHVFWDRRNSSRLGGHCIRRSTLCRHLRGLVARSAKLMERCSDGVGDQGAEDVL
jgi:hypothetical protein